MNSIQGIMVLSLIVVTIIGGLLALAHAITKWRLKVSHSTNKALSFECGVVGQEASSSKVSSGFYLVAILFVLFDIEIIFLYPWALAYRDFIGSGHGLYYFVALLIFLGIFILGLLWEIRVKALTWR